MGKMSMFLDYKSIFLEKIIKKLTLRNQKSNLTAMEIWKARVT